LLTFKEQVHEERVDIANLWPNIDWRCAIRHDVNQPVKQKPNLSTQVSYFFSRSRMKHCRAGILVARWHSISVSCFSLWKAQVSEEGGQRGQVLHQAVPFPQEAETRRGETRVQGNKAAFTRAMLVAFSSAVMSAKAGNPYWRGRLCTFSWPPY
jgi:hypothetical protein